MVWKLNWRPWKPRIPTGPLRLAPLKATAARHGVSRVSATIDGHELWFESQEVQLSLAPEALGSAFLTPSLKLGRPLHVDAPVCDRWLAGQAQAANLMSGWWGYRGSHTTALKTHQPTPSPQAQGRAVQCFTGGVDSFYSLLRDPTPVRALMMVLGYDVDLRDRRHIESSIVMVRQVAAEMGLESLFVATNLRRHPTFRSEGWERTHGGALGAMAHLLSDQFDALHISATITRGGSQPLGSRWDIDGFHSSAKTQIEHIGADATRVEKLIDMAEEPLVRNHLRVCWQRNGQGGNCGRCEKCTRTRLILEVCGQLPHFTVFPGAPAVLDALNSVASLNYYTLPAYRQLLGFNLTPTLDAAVRRLIDRTYAKHPEFKLQAA